MSLNQLISSSDRNSSERRSFCVKNGHYIRKSDGARVQRYLNRDRKHSSSEASNELCKNQKKRIFNQMIFELLVSGVSQRRCAYLCRLNRKTIVRKFIFLGFYSQRFLPLITRTLPKVETMEFDDLETFEHSKCKPVSVSLAVQYKTRWILGFRVSQMPAKGRLVAIARRRYGYREDLRKAGRESLFKELQGVVSPEALIKSDKNPHYLPDIKKYFPKARHQTTKGRRGCVVGQGELKSGRRDPLFTLNHTFAMLRANINRLFRKTWCTTKLKERLGFHIAMYAMSHNLAMSKRYHMNLNWNRI